MQPLVGSAAAARLAGRNSRRAHVKTITSLARRVQGTSAPNSMQRTKKNMQACELQDESLLGGLLLLVLGLDDLLHNLLLLNQERADDAAKTRAYMEKEDKQKGKADVEEVRQYYHTLGCNSTSRPSLIRHVRKRPSVISTVAATAHGWHQMAMPRDQGGPLREANKANSRTTLLQISTEALDVPPEAVHLAPYSHTTTAMRRVPGSRASVPRRRNTGPQDRDTRHTGRVTESAACSPHSTTRNRLPFGTALPGSGLGAATEMNVGELGNDKANTNTQHQAGQKKRTARAPPSRTGSRHTPASPSSWAWTCA